MGWTGQAVGMRMPIGNLISEAKQGRFMAQIAYIREGLSYARLDSTALIG